MAFWKKVLEDALDELLTQTLPTPRLPRRRRPVHYLKGEPCPGTPVYCKLAVVAEHTGIYVGDGKIVHLNGDGSIEFVSPEQFVSRLDGFNPAGYIYCAADRHKKALGNAEFAERARAMVSRRRNYNWAFDNCHKFTCGCLTGDFDNPCSFFWMLELKIREQLGRFVWARWDF